jgi:hypothetical protein
MAKQLLGAVPQARYVLGAVRLVNGAATLFVTRPFGKRLGVDPDTSPAAVYALRLFGVRTIYIGAELLFARGEHLRHAVAIAPVIHVSDTVSAVLAGAGGQLPKKAARTAAVISSVNVVLSLLGWSSPKRRRRGLPWIG